MNKQLVINWGWDNGTLHILPNIIIHFKSEIEFVWLGFYLDIYHPKKDVYG